MSAHRTYRGTEFNMAAFADANGNTPALGNSGRNARGDVIDKTGRIIATAQEVNAAYNKKNPKAVAKVSITKDTEARLAGQTPKTTATPNKPMPTTKPNPTTKSNPVAASADVEVSRKTITLENGDTRTEITYADGSVEVI